MSFARREDITPKDLGGGVTRRVLAHNPDIMAVEVSFEKGARGERHTHPHTQISYALSGRFIYSLGDEEYELNPGDSIAVPGGAVHGTLCLEKGALLDVFTPQREDFLK
jgi:quercetin dioxygenase-like cupin family protein